MTKTNHILHYTLEKEKEERMDLQEMYDIVESDHKKFKNETLSRIKDMETNIEELNYENHQLKQAKEELETKCEELQVTFWDIKNLSFIYIIYIFTRENSVGEMYIFVVRMHWA